MWQRSAMPNENPSPRPVKLKTAHQYRRIAELARQTATDPARTDLLKADRAKLYVTALIADSLARTMAKREAQEQQASEPQPERDKINDQP
jgi:hypothetical protein